MVDRLLIKIERCVDRDVYFVFAFWWCWGLNLRLSNWATSPAFFFFLFSFLRQGPLKSLSCPPSLGLKSSGLSLPARSRAYRGAPPPSANGLVLPSASKPCFKISLFCTGSWKQKCGVCIFLWIAACIFFRSTWFCKVIKYKEIIGVLSVVKSVNQCITGVK